MGRWNFGLQQLFLLMAVIALGLVALRSATMTWVAGMLGLALAVLTASVLLVIFRRGRQRAFWIGFATVGWIYLLLLFASWTIARMPSDDNPLRAHNLITQQLASVSYHWLYDKAFERHFASVPGGGNYGPLPGGGYAGSGMMPGGFGGPGPSSGPPPGPNEGDFVNVAHALWTLILASMGGWLALWLYATGPGRNESIATASVNSRGT